MLSDSFTQKCERLSYSFQNALNFQATWISVLKDVSKEEGIKKTVIMKAQGIKGLFKGIRASVSIAPLQNF